MFRGHWGQRFEGWFGHAEQSGPPWGRERHGRGGRFERGDMRYVVLSLLGERPMHGYEVIREMERRFSGMYTPSAGSVYPTLQLLEDMGLVTSNQEEGKKVYTITNAGRAFLEERRDRVEDVWERAGDWHRDDAHRDELRALFDELRALAMALRPIARGLSTEQIKRLRELMARVRGEMEDILRRPAS